MDKINYQKKLDLFIDRLVADGTTPKLMLHSCCAPCSSYCIEYLSQYFEITVFYYNPNIYPDEEYWLRVKEQQRFIENFPTKNKVSFIEGDYDKQCFYDMAKGLENVPERGERCHKCYELRLRKTAEIAQKEQCDYFATTLTISPQKDSSVLNAIGERIANDLGNSVKYLATDFKKKSGYLRSCEISKEYDMYRQDYCGCVFSYNERMRDK